MSINFDEIIERRTSGSAKWNFYAEDVLPMWVADMDFRAPRAISEALRRRADHGIFGYAMPPSALHEALCTRLHDRYGWAVTPEQLVYYPGVVTGVNMAARAFSANGAGMIIQTPVYPPILHTPEYSA